MGKRVTLEQLRPDMVLATDVADNAGRLLLPAGTALTEKHVRYCQMWGILELEIEAEAGADVAPDVAEDPTRLAAAASVLAPRFARVDLDHPVMASLFRHVVRNQAAKPC
jgi:hypothetical protein